MTARLLLKSLTLVFFAPEASADLIYAKCISESGRSTYNLELDTKRQSGEIRYQFMMQDVFYDVQLNSKNTTMISGIAKFKGSLSGETKGNPFTFSYDAKNQTFHELNITAICTKLGK